MAGQRNSGCSCNAPLQLKSDNQTVGRYCRGCNVATCSYNNNGNVDNYDKFRQLKTYVKRKGEQQQHQQQQEEQEGKLIGIFCKKCKSEWLHGEYMPCDGNDDYDSVRDGNVFFKFSPSDPACGKSREKESIELISQLDQGDHITWHRPCGYHHHGIVMEVIGDGQSGKIETLEWSSIGGSAATSSQEHQPQFKRMYRIKYHEDVTVQNSVDLTLARAQSREREPSTYSIWKDNCEHFGTYCKTGVERSHQADSLFKRILQLFVLIFQRFAFKFTLLILVSEVADNLAPEDDNCRTVDWRNEAIGFGILFALEACFVIYDVYKACRNRSDLGNSVFTKTVSQRVNVGFTLWIGGTGFSIGFEKLYECTLQCGFAGAVLGGLLGVALLAWLCQVCCGSCNCWQSCCLGCAKLCSDCKSCDCGTCCEDCNCATCCEDCSRPDFIDMTTKLLVRIFFVICMETVKAIVIKTPLENLDRDTLSKQAGIQVGMLISLEVVGFLIIGTCVVGKCFKSKPISRTSTDIFYNLLDAIMFTVVSTVCSIGLEHRYTVSEKDYCGLDGAVLGGILGGIAATVSFPVVWTILKYSCYLGCFITCCLWKLVCDCFFKEVSESGTTEDGESGAEIKVPLNRVTTDAPADASDVPTTCDAAGGASECGQVNDTLPQDGAKCVHIA